MPHDERALSELVAHLLIAFLVIVIALLIISAFNGTLTRFLHAPGLAVVTATPYDTGTGHIIRLHHEQGDAVNLNGTSQTGGKTEIALMLTSSSGPLVPVTNAATMGPEPWGPGQTVYIYKESGSYVYRDTPPPGSAIPKGDYTVQIIDTRTMVLLHTLPVTIP
jgi:hypothetical protein